MNKRCTQLLAGLILLCLSPLSALAAGHGPFSVAVDCGGNVAAGDLVPFTIRAENQNLQAQPMELSMRLRGPFGGVIPMFSTSITLGPNQNLAVDRSLGLPAGVPAGSYTLILVGAGTTFTSFDTCSFNVI